jgi:hypothetical protein
MGWSWLYIPCYICWIYDVNLWCGLGDLGNKQTQAEKEVSQILISIYQIEYCENKVVDWCKKPIDFFRPFLPFA